MDCSPPGSSVHAILQARILEPVAISFSRGPSRPGNRTSVSFTVGRFFTNWATREAPSQILRAPKSSACPNPFPQVSNHISNSLLNTISFPSNIIQQGFLGGSEVRESACQCRRHRFDPWSGKIPYAEQLSPCTATSEPTCHNQRVAPTCCN